jgi:hypothetical protein
MFDSFATPIPLQPGRRRADPSNRLSRLRPRLKSPWQCSISKIFGGSCHSGNQAILLQNTDCAGGLLDHERKSSR